MTTRIYIVTNGANEPRLVRAANQAQAIRHVTKPLYAAFVAGQDDLIKALSNGAKVEEAKTEDEAE